MFGDGLSDELKALLGEAGFVALAEAFGGTRLHVPVRPGADHEITNVLGDEGAAQLAKRYSPSAIRVPLARDERARHYRANGLSNARIARKLGLTEPGVDRIFKRMEAAPGKGSAQSLPKPTAQLDLFDR